MQHFQAHHFNCKQVQHFDHLACDVTPYFATQTPATQGTLQVSNIQYFSPIIYVCFVLLSVITCSLVQAENSSQLARTTVETSLPNGLKVIIREDHRAPLVMTQIWYGVGSSDESGNILGISHALEHMMFKGTNKVPDDEFNRLSRKFGGRNNAATNLHYTYYYQLYPSQYFPMALELEADRMRNIVFKQSDFAAEMKVVMEERRLRTEDQPRQLAYERFKWLAYPTSHSRQPVIGLMKNLNNIQLKQVKAWYDAWYRPNNAILVIVGDVNAEQALLQVKKYFSAIPAQAVPERNDVIEFDRIGYRHMQINAAVQVPNLYMAWNVRSLVTSKNPQDAYALSIIHALLDGGISSRLEDRLIRDRKILSAIQVSYDPYSRGDTLFSITAIPNQGVTLAQAQRGIEAELDRLKVELIDQNTLDTIKANYIANLVYAQDDIGRQASSIGNLEVNGLSYRLLDELPKHYDTVSPNDLKRIANVYFVADNLSTLYLSPAQEP